MVKVVVTLDGHEYVFDCCSLRFPVYPYEFVVFTSAGDEESQHFYDLRDALEVDFDEEVL